ncbi:MAG TPA: HAMP domain-containing sensor histidine kinase, partial [Ramlibacter sp.]
MKIGEFVEQQVRPIVQEWVEFARERVPTAHAFTHEDLADHARVLLLAIAADLGQTQGATAKHEKSQGQRPGNAPDITRIAHDHAAQRFAQGFTFDHLVSEFRALRASVIRRWTQQLQAPGREEVDELTRFGESMDQALSESTSLYTKKLNDSRVLLLGVLGHDLRTPLGVVHMSAQYLLRTETLSGAQTKAVARILTAADRMTWMVKDILDFTQTAFGVSLPIAPEPADLKGVTQQIVAEVSALHPDSNIELTAEGDLAGKWDAPRIAQMLANLVANAVQHGTTGAPVTILLDGDTQAVRVRISNFGPAIPAEGRENLFTPLRQAPTTPAQRHAGSSGLGLGLYIAKEIAVAHGG